MRSAGQRTPAWLLSEAATCTNVTELYASCRAAIDTAAIKFKNGCISKCVHGVLLQEAADGGREDTDWGGGGGPGALPEHESSGPAPERLRSFLYGLLRRCSPA